MITYNFLVKKVPFFPKFKTQTIKKTSRIINKELLTPLEEARLTVEEIVIPKQTTIDLLPRKSSIRKLQHEHIKHYQLTTTSIKKLM